MFFYKLIDLRKYFYFLSLITAIVLCGWYLALGLTKQRLQLEAVNKLNSNEQKISTFTWDFVDFRSDIVAPYQKYWSQDKPGIVAKKQVNPELSLNFSGEFINTLHHNQLHIKGTQPFSGTVILQITSGFDDPNFYYSEVINLTGSEVVVDLKKPWKPSSPSQTKKEVNWEESLRHISSLVLYFKNPDQALHIESISLNHNETVQKKQYMVNCQAEILSENLPDERHLNIFTIAESCFFPSNYLWLNHTLQKRYAESVIKVNDWHNESDIHKVNKSYSHLWKINTTLYVFIISAFIVMALFTRTYRQDNNAKNSDTVTFLKRLAVMIGYKMIRPYHFVINYLWVLIPTGLMLLILSWFKWPDVKTFDMLPMYFLWALLQQFILVNIFADYIFYQRLRNRLFASVLAALVFALIHLPSVTLMLVTFFAGCFWAYAGLLFRRLLPLALSHALLALMFYFVVPDQFLYSAKVLQWYWE